MTLVRLEPAAPRSGVKHSTTALPMENGTETIASTLKFIDQNFFLCMLSMNKFYSLKYLNPNYLIV